MDLKQIYVIIVATVIIVIIMIFRCEHYDKSSPQGINFYTTINIPPKPSSYLGTINATGSPTFTINNMNNILDPMFVANPSPDSISTGFCIQNNSSKTIKSITVGGDFFNTTYYNTAVYLYNPRSNGPWQSFSPHVSFNSSFTAQISSKPGEELILDIANLYQDMQGIADSSLSFTIEFL